LFNLGVLIYSCSESEVRDKSFESSATLNYDNNFIPLYPYDIPRIEIKPGEYFNQVVGNYRVDAIIDSLNPIKVYLKIKDSLEGNIYQGYTLDGKKNGWWEVLNSNKIMCCGNYDLNKKFGYWRFFHLIDESQKFVNFKNDTLEGLAQEYSVDSILLTEGYYVGGVKSDYWKFFYCNGNIKEQGYFHDGYKSGWWQSFERNGHLIEEASYSRNEISGYMKKYFHGIISEEGKIYNGIKRGTWKFYDEEGKLKRLEEHEE
jgi:antitoxin component YwqK of YwqJK toxin-antitoxin module